MLTAVAYRVCLVNENEAVKWRDLENHDARFLYESHYSTLCVKIPKFLLLWQQGPVFVNFSEGVK